MNRTNPTICNPLPAPARRRAVWLFRHPWRWVCLWVGLGLGLPLPVRAAGEWQEISRTNDLTVYVRDRTGSPFKEVRATGTIEAPLGLVRSVLTDFDAYQTFMPYTSESRVLTRDPATRSTLVYLKLNPPLASARDVTIRVQDESFKAADDSYTAHWAADNAAGPAPQVGVTRMSLDEGTWVLEPTGDRKATKATYSLFTDAGGNLPAFVINLANKRSVADLFDALRKQVRKSRPKDAPSESGS
ncbi:MAG TPA: SRPBCC family protein [Chthoniobacterales bacterium]